MRVALAVITTISATAISLAASHAQEPQKRERPRLDAAFFDRLDTNKDGVITLDEIPEERRERVKPLIERLDADKDGKVTRKEFDAAVEQARPKGERPGEPRLPGRPGGPPPEGQRRPLEPAKPGEPAPLGQPPFPPGPGRPPFGFGGPDLFRALDTNNDGKLSRDELAKAVDVLMKLDKNEDGSLTPDEVAEGIRGARPGPGPLPPGAPAPAGPEFVANMIRRADKNGDGKLSKDEVPELLRERFEQLDTNKDGAIDKEELGAVGERFRRLRGQDSEPPRFPGRPGPGAPGKPDPGAPDRPAVKEASRERVANFLREHDKDADGRISLKEFGEDRTEQFKKLDLNADGFLTPDEIARGLPQRGEAPEGRGRPEARREPKKDDSDK